VLFFYRLATGFLSTKAYATTLNTNTIYGTASVPPISFDSAVASFVQVANDTIGIVCTALFIVGAFFFTISAGDDARKSLGVDLMKGAAMGMAVVIGANGIINMIVYFLE
jgi:hypothetical protein